MAEDNDSTSQSEGKRDKRSHRTEIIVAVIGLLGILATAVLANWDKIFPEPVDGADTTRVVESKEVKPIKVNASVFAYTDSENPDTPFPEIAVLGETSQLRPGTGEQTVYVRFDVGQQESSDTKLRIIPGTAKVKFEETDRKVNVTELVVYPVSGNWSPTNLTHNNSPGYNTSTEIFGGALVHGKNEYQSDRLNEVILSWILQPERNYGIALRAVRSYHSVDNSDRIIDLELEFDLEVTSYTQK